MPWTPPSLKAAEKLPCIEIAEPDQVQTYLDWFDAHGEINRCIPPLYKDFIIKFSRRFSEGRRTPDTHHYVEIVHYDDTLTELEAVHVLDGKKILRIAANYAEIDGKRIHVKLTAPTNSPFTESWLKDEAVAVACTVLSVQAHILYHRPEVIPVVLPAPERRSGGKRTPTQRKIKQTVRKYIRLSASDPLPSVRNYRAIQWQVRGHYRRITGADGKERLVYVRPHLAKRGNRKTAARLIIE